MIRIKEILRLSELGCNQTEIAKSVGVARSTVQDYLKGINESGVRYKEIQEHDDKHILTLLGKHGKGGVTGKVGTIDFSYIHAELGRKGVTRELLWKELTEKGAVDCSYNNFCRHYRLWSLQTQVTMRQEHRAGEKLFVDYSGLKVSIYPPDAFESVQLEIFVCCFGVSNYIYCEATVSQSLEHWLGSHVRALAFFGGAPKVIVPDNLKSGVTKACRYEPEINRSYLDFSEHYNLAIIPTRTRKPRDKAKVEKAVQDVERSVLAPLRDVRFTTLAEVNQAIKSLLSALNSRTMKLYNMSRVEMFERYDKPELQPLPTFPYTFSHWKKCKPNLDYHIQVEGNYYSVPYTAIHKELWVKITEKVVEVFLENKRIAVHTKSEKKFSFTTMPEHMPSNHRGMKTYTADYFIEWSKSIGKETETQVLVLLNTRTHHEQSFRSILGLKRLVKEYGADRVEAACKRANHYLLASVKSIKNILLKNQEVLPLTEEQERNDLPHANIRGSNYYH